MMMMMMMIDDDNDDDDDLNTFDLRPKCTDSFVHALSKWPKNPGLNIVR